MNEDDDNSTPRQPVLHDKQKSNESSSTIEVDISSVVTQVTTRDTPNVRNKPSFQLAGRNAHPSWKTKVRSLLCCFAPKPKPLPSHAPPALLRERGPLIGPKHPSDSHKKTLVLDLDETLVHSSFKPIETPDCIVPVEIEGRNVDVYVLKRPCLDKFMESVGQRFEVVVFTASLGKYADPLLDWLDKDNVVRWRLFREACLPWEGNYVKDLSFLGRDLCDTIIVDNSPHSYVFQPENALPISTFIDDMHDQDLLKLIPILDKLETVADVRSILAPASNSKGGLA
mmetsp:Transcript_15092/g.40822  ORF Transcript_15092/g.40822 Transcript_15092/m.40822 type:complete len:284 (+) Transcript_15092:160-1011(+)|eukprot:CAMPEP_0202347208 /NCGR_PEP_ID=MMETSP1126-20121109/5670_1 /ASSEMBLY_ACC=CAM_ASM_000457 /TAXON_ID=3047 /ORGANISM="Dunaliella tertiolecta, Strain CCMP1320" /LENGTH=283 /DNA_ID=CAMNT_0048938729 /DNA_START=167 /DNA_END=1018 /DNA_ORIENTATION=+